MDKNQTISCEYYESELFYLVISIKLCIASTSNEYEKIGRRNVQVAVLRCQECSQARMCALG